MKDGTAVVDAAGSASPWWPIGTVTVWQTSASICFYAVFAGTALFRSVFELSRTLTGLVITVLMTGYVVALLPVGSAIDAAGEGSAMTVGLLGLVVALVGVAVATSYRWLLLAVFVLGLCYSTAIPATNRAVVASVPARYSNLGMGIKQVGVTAGSGISAVLVTVLAERFGWRSGFVFAAVLGVIVLVGFASVYDGRDGAGEWRLPDPRWLLARRQSRLLLVAGFVLGGALFTTTGYVTVYATDAVGAPVAVGGGLLALTQVTGSVGRVLFGVLVDRLSDPTATAAARVLRGQAAASALLLVAAGLVGTLHALVVAFGALGLTLLGFTGVYHSCLTAVVPDERVGEATAVGQSALTGGAVLTPASFGAVADHVGYGAAWGGLGVLCLVAAGAVTVGHAVTE